MEKAIVSTIRQRSDFIRYVEFLCRKNLKDEDGDNFMRLVSTFFIHILDDSVKVINSLDFIDNLGSFDKIKAYFIAYYSGNLKKDTFRNSFFRFMDEHKNCSDNLSDRALRIFVLFADLFDDKKLLEYGSKKYSDIVQKSELVKDYVSILLKEKRTDLAFESWGSGRFDFDDIIKARLLFLGGVRIKEKRAFYLREHYRIVSNFFNKFNVFEISQDITGDSLFKLVVQALILRKIGYDEGIFLPSIERIGYLEDIIGKGSLSEVLLRQVTNDIFSLKIPVLEEAVSKWLPIRLEIFLVRWPLLCFLLWGIIRNLTKFRIFKDKSLNIYINYTFLGLFIGGLLVYILFNLNLSRIKRKIGRYNDSVAH